MTFASVVLLLGGILTVITGARALRDPEHSPEHGVPPGRGRLYLLGGLLLCVASIVLLVGGFRYGW